MNLFGVSLRNWIIIIAGVIVLSFLFFLFFKEKILSSKKKINFFKLVLLGILFVIIKIGFYYLKSWNVVFFYFVFPSVIVGGIAYLYSIPQKINELWDVRFKTNKGEKILKGLIRGVAIFGSAGSGKTASVIYTIMQHLGLRNVAGIIYDFKDGELTELAVPIFKEKLKIVAIHKPYLSARVNPISPQFIEGEKDVNEIVSVIMDNLSAGNDGDNFFKDSASSLLAGVILKFYFDHKPYCTLPHVISFILGLDFSIKEMETKGMSLGEQAENKFAKLKDFLTKDDRVAIQSSTFLLGLASEKQTAAVLSTLANALRKIAFPEAYWVLSDNDIELDINSKENNSVISIMNEPKSSKFLSPINATIIHTISKQMMVRDREPSFILLDEAPTIRLLNMAEIPATMRSFGVAVIYCAQDIVQGFVKYGREGFKEILANLSTQFFGKANDPDTAKYYEGYFELIKIKTKTTSRKGGDGDLFTFGEYSTSIGEREVSKYRASEFTKLQIGQFAMLSDGVSDIVKFTKPNLVKGTLNEVYYIDAQKLNNNFMKIVNDVKTLI